jgi:hypothetical protein
MKRLAVRRLQSPLRPAKSRRSSSMSRFPLWMWLLVTFGPNAAQAQTPRAPGQGQRVRVAHGCEIARDQPIECRDRRSLRVEIGQFLALDGDTLRMRAQSTDAEVAIPMAYVTHVWVADGSRTHFWAGAGIGSLAGALLFGLTAEQNLICSSPSCNAAFGAAGGFFWGGVVGALVKSDRWRPVPVSNLRMSLEPQLDALGLRVSVAF